MSSELLPLEAITQCIVVLRGQKVLLDADLAALYGVETRRLNPVPSIWPSYLDKIYAAVTTHARLKNCAAAR